MVCCCRPFDADEFFLLFWFRQYFRDQSDRGWRRSTNQGERAGPSDREMQLSHWLRWTFLWGVNSTLSSSLWFFFGFFYKHEGRSQVCSRPFLTEVQFTFTSEFLSFSDAAETRLLFGFISFSPSLVCIKPQRARPLLSFDFCLSKLTFSGVQAPSLKPPDARSGDSISTLMRVLSTSADGSWCTQAAGTTVDIIVLIPGVRKLLSALFTPALTTVYAVSEKMSRVHDSDAAARVERVPNGKR